MRAGLVMKEIFLEYTFGLKIESSSSHSEDRFVPRRCVQTLSEFTKKPTGSRSLQSLEVNVGLGKPAKIIHKVYSNLVCCLTETGTGVAPPH